MSKKGTQNWGFNWPNRPGSAREGNKPGVARRCQKCHFSLCRCKKETK